MIVLFVEVATYEYNSANASTQLSLELYIPAYTAKRECSGDSQAAATADW